MNTYIILPKFSHLFNALFSQIKSIYVSMTINDYLEISSKVPINNFLFEASFHYESFLYNEWINSLSSKSFEKKFYSFEQVSWAAEIEKNLVFNRCELNQIQVGILPPFPYPTLGCISNFIVRNTDTLSEYSIMFNNRNFKKLDVDLNIFVQSDAEPTQFSRIIFATQPYRKLQENKILSFLDNKLKNNLMVKLHPRDYYLSYSKYNLVESFRSNDLVITRTSSLTIELFQKGIPYVCIIDEEDEELNTGEVSNYDDYVVFKSIEAAYEAIKENDKFLRSFFAWRKSKILKYYDK